jgi:superfamily II DNA or RNA helicase
MFRKTSSWLVFLQQIGRIVTLSKNPDPRAIVFDFVNNIDTVSYNNTYTQEHGNKIIVKLKEYKSDSIIVGDESRDIVEAIRAIKKFEDDSWEDWEIDILKKYYVKEGPEGCQKRIDEEFERRYPGTLTNE